MPIARPAAAARTPTSEKVQQLLALMRGSSFFPADIRGQTVMRFCFGTTSPVLTAQHKSHPLFGAFQGCDYEALKRKLSLTSCGRSTNGWRWHQYVQHCAVLTLAVASVRTCADDCFVLLTAAARHSCLVHVGPSRSRGAGCTRSLLRLAALLPPSVHRSRAGESCKAKRPTLCRLLGHKSPSYPAETT